MGNVSLLAMAAGGVPCSRRCSTAAASEIRRSLAYSPNACVTFDVIHSPCAPPCEADAEKQVSLPAREFALRPYLDLTRPLWTFILENLEPRRVRPACAGARRRMAVKPKPPASRGQLQCSAQLASRHTGAPSLLIATSFLSLSQLLQRQCCVPTPRFPPQEQSRVNSKAQRPHACRCFFAASAPP